MGSRQPGPRARARIPATKDTRRYPLGGKPEADIEFEPVPGMAGPTRFRNSDNPIVHPDESIVDGVPHNPRRPRN